MVHLILKCTSVLLVEFTFFVSNFLKTLAFPTNVQYFRNEHDILKNRQLCKIDRSFFDLGLKCCSVVTPPMPSLFHHYENKQDKYFLSMVKGIMHKSGVFWVPVTSIQNKTKFMLLNNRIFGILEMVHLGTTQQAFAALGKC